jgi:hypothetical protein
MQASVAPDAQPVLHQRFTPQVTGIAHVTSSPEQPPALAVWTAAGLALAVVVGHLVLIRRSNPAALTVPATTGRRLAVA